MLNSSLLTQLAESKEISTRDKTMVNSRIMALLGLVQVSISNQNQVKIL